MIEDALLSAVERGVRAYLLTSAEVKLKTSEGEDWGRDDEIRELHKKMLARMAGKVYLRSSGHFHAKYVLIDSNRGVMTTCNLTTRPSWRILNSLFLLMRLDGTGLELFRYQFWEGSEKEMLQKGTLDGVESENRFSSLSLMRVCVARTSADGALPSSTSALLSSNQRPNRSM